MFGLGACCALHDCVAGERTACATFACDKQMHFAICAWRGVVWVVQHTLDNGLWPSCLLPICFDRCKTERVRAYSVCYAFAQKGHVSVQSPTTRQRALHPAVESSRGVPLSTGRASQREP